MHYNTFSDKLTGNPTTDAFIRMNELEAAITSHISGGMDLLKRHWSFFGDRPIDNKVSYLIGAGFVSTLFAACAYGTAKQYDISPSYLNLTTATAFSAGTLVSTGSYLYSTEQDPEYQMKQKELTLSSLQTKLQDIYDKDPILHDYKCPILLTIMWVPVILPYSPDSLANWKERQRQPCSPYVCDRTTLKINPETETMTHHETRHSFKPSELIDDHVSAIQIYKRLRHLLSKDLALTIDTHSPEREFIKSYIEEINKQLKTHYETMYEDMKNWSFSKEPTPIAFTQLKEKFMRLEDLAVNPWANEEIQPIIKPQVEHSPFIPQKNLSNPFTNTDQIKKIISEIPTFKENQ